MKFFDVLKKPSRLIAIILLAVVATFSLLSYCADFGSGFLPGVSSFLGLLLTLSIYGGLVFLLIVKKNELFTYFFAIYFAYWIFSTIFGDLGVIPNYDFPGMTGLPVAHAVFLFFCALCMIGVLVTFVISKLLRKPQLHLITLFIMIGSTMFFFIDMILYMAIASKYRFGWGSYFDALNIFLLPVALTFCYLAVDRTEYAAGKAAPAPQPAQADFFSAEANGDSYQPVIETIENNEYEYNPVVETVENNEYEYNPVVETVENNEYNPVVETVENNEYNPVVETVENNEYAPVIETVEEDEYKALAAEPADSFEDFFSEEGVPAPEGIKKETETPEE